jgi:pyruvate kinase
MRINYHKIYTPFIELKPGDCFLNDDGDISMKIVNEETNEVGAVVLEDGKMWFPHLFEGYQTIDPVLEV